MVRSPARSESIVGVDLGGTKVLAGLVEVTGRVAATARGATEGRRGPDAVLSDLARMIEGLEGRPVAVGVGIAGQVDSVRGVLRASPNLPDWKDVPVARTLEGALGIPVAVTNDVRAVAWGEWQAGAGRGVQTLAVVFVGTGIGGGLVADGRMLEGANGTAGELGHQTVVTQGGRRCHCPNHGCLEAYAGGWAIAERAQEAVGRSARAVMTRMAGSRGAITAATVAQAYAAGDALARTLVEETAGYLGAGLANVANAFNPERIVLGGGVIDGIPDLVRLADAEMRQRALPPALLPLSVVRGELGPHACLVGAASLARKRARAPDRPASRRRKGT